MSVEVAQRVRDHSLRVDRDEQETALFDQMADDVVEPEWWQGLAFEGVMDPRGQLFAGILAGFATLALVVIAFAVVTVVTGG